MLLKRHITFKGHAIYLLADINLSKAKLNLSEWNDHANRDFPILMQYENCSFWNQLLLWEDQQPDGAIYVELKPNYAVYFRNVQWCWVFF